MSDDIERRINPSGDTVTTIWDCRNHVKLREITPGGEAQIWTPKSPEGYFGIMESYQDLSSTVTRYAYNQKFELIQKLGEGGKHGNTARLVVSYNGGATLYSLDTSQPVPGQNLRFTLVAGRLMTVYDDAQGLRSNYDYDAEDRLSLVEMYRYDGSLIRRVTCALDALGRQTNFFDTMLTGINEYDQNSNLRHRVSQIISPVTGGAVVDDNWYLYNTADQVLVVDGVVSNGTIVRNSGKSSSYSIEYSSGVRVREIDNQGRACPVEIWADGNIALATEGDGTRHNYYYSPNGSVHYHIQWDPDGTKTQDTTVCNPDLFETSQYTQKTEPGKSVETVSNTSFRPDPNNNIGTQDTTDYSNGQDNPITYNLTFYYQGINDKFETSTIAGDTHDKDGSKHVQSSVYYDSNGSTIGVEHSDDDDGNTKFFTQTWSGFPIQKISFPKKPDKNKAKYKYTNYFYTVDDNYLSSFEIDSAYELNMLLNYSSVRNPGHWGQMNLTPSALSTGSSSVQGINPRPAGTMPKRLKYEEKGFELSGDYVSSVSKIDVQTVPETYVVQTGDTFDNIALSQYGNRNMAAKIAEKNNYVASDTPRVGEQLTLPQYIPNSNRADENVPFKRVQDTMLGHLAPKLKFAQPKHHSDCTTIIILAAAAVVAAVVAPHVAAALAPVIFSGLGAAGTAAGTMVVTGVVAGVIDAGIQGVAVGVGALKNFSLESVIEVALSAGIADGLGVDKLGGLGQLGTAQFFEELALVSVAAAVTDVAVQVSEIIQGRSSKINLTQTMVAMGTAAVSFAASAGVAKLWKSPTVNLVVDDVASGATGLLLGGAVMGGKLNVESAGAQLAGTLIGQAVTTPIQMERQKSEPMQTSATKIIFPTSQQVDLSDYHQAVAVGQGRITNSLPDYAWNSQLDMPKVCPVDFEQDAISDTSRTPGSTQAKTPALPTSSSTIAPPPTSKPAPSTALPVPKVATPNSYVNAGNVIKQELANMLAQNMQNYVQSNFSDSSVMDPSWLAPTSSGPHLRSMSTSNLLSNFPKTIPIAGTISPSYVLVGAGILVGALLVPEVVALGGMGMAGMAIGGMFGEAGLGYTIGEAIPAGLADGIGSFAGGTAGAKMSSWFSKGLSIFRGSERSGIASQIANTSRMSLTGSSVDTLLAGASQTVQEASIPLKTMISQNESAFFEASAIPDKIRINPSQLKSTHEMTLSKRAFQKLLKNIQENGIQKPISYVEHEGENYVVDGHHRLFAARKLGLTDVPIEKVELPYAGYKTSEDLYYYGPSPYNY